MVSPMFSPVTRSAIFLPTMTSYRPGVKLRPSTIFTLLRTLKTMGGTPRMVMLAGWPSLRRGLLARMTTSHEAMAFPALSRATCGSAIDDIGVGNVDPRGQLGGRAALGDDAVQRRAGGTQRDAEAGLHRQQGDEYRDHQGDADDRQQRDLPALAKVADVV